VQSSTATKNKSYNSHNSYDIKNIDLIRTSD